MGFADDVAAWTKKAVAGRREYFGRSVELLAEAINTPRPTGALPHDTGRMIRSFMASTSPISIEDPGQDYTAQDVGLVAAKLEPGDTVFLGWQVAYAARQNYGLVGQDSMGRNYNQSGAHFVEHGVAQWDQIKKRAWKEIFGG